MEQADGDASENTDQHLAGARPLSAGPRLDWQAKPAHTHVHLMQKPLPQAAGELYLYLAEED